MKIIIDTDKIDGFNNLQDIPKNCKECPYRNDIPSDSTVDWDCDLIGYGYKRNEGIRKRIKDCPIIEKVN